MRFKLVVVGTDRVVDMAMHVFWRWVKAPHHQVYWSRSSMGPPLWLGGPWSEAAYCRLDAWLKSSVDPPPMAGGPLA